ncbi:histidine-rich glycoprotein-like isoform X2 [Oppia nitens]|nr:histidine-rich glycoprotein-like isoform X2 [Oppia nitens]
MGLFSCFGGKSRSYNAKKHEMDRDRQSSNKKSSRRGTDSIGVPDSNLVPSLIQETGYHETDDNNKGNDHRNHNHEHQSQEVISNSDHHNGSAHHNSSGYNNSHSTHDNSSSVGHNDSSHHQSYDTHVVHHSSD